MRTRLAWTLAPKYLTLDISDGSHPYAALQGSSTYYSYRGTSIKRTRLPPMTLQLDDAWGAMGALRFCLSEVVL